MTAVDHDDLHGAGAAVDDGSESEVLQDPRAAQLSVGLGVDDVDECALTAGAITETGIDGGALHSDATLTSGENRSSDEKLRSYINLNPLAFVAYDEGAVVGAYLTADG